MLDQDLFLRKALIEIDDLVTGLRVDTGRMAATLAAAGEAVLAEQRSMAAAAGHEPAPSYLGDAGAYVDAVVARARRTEFEHHHGHEHEEER